ncbi:MAG: BspA family leucine-rich repeat surface protein [Flavobacteriaceae bacterium]|nr:BspA family leucine-rich repeat surface protein [Flavobacteriaceae bacterium]
MKASAGAVNGDTGVLDGVTYTVVNLSTLNSKISNGNDVTKVVPSLVTDMSYIFDGSSLNQDIGSWDVSNVINMSDMFSFATAFNQDLSNWDVSNVINMSYMFYGATFNQNLSSWSVSNVINCTYFSYDAPLTEANTPNFTNCTF